MVFVNFRFRLLIRVQNIKSLRLCLLWFHFKQFTYLSCTLLKHLLFSIDLKLKLYLVFFCLGVGMYLLYLGIWYLNLNLDLDLFLFLLL